MSPSTESIAYGSQVSYLNDRVPPGVRIARSFSGRPESNRKTSVPSPLVVDVPLQSVYVPLVDVHFVVCAPTIVASKRAYRMPAAWAGVAASAATAAAASVVSPLARMCLLVSSD